MNGAFLQDGGGLPGGRQTEVIIAVIIPVVVDVQTVGIEVADVDTVAVRIHIICQLSPESLEIKVYCP